MPQLEVPGGDAGGETIHYQRAGSGAKVIVLVHGFGSDARSWTMNQPGLAASAKVYALDLPGHGASPARDIGGLDRLAGIKSAEWQRGQFTALEQAHHRAHQKLACRGFVDQQQGGILQDHDGDLEPLFLSMAK